MYRINITKGKLGDLLVLLLFEKFKDENFIKESETFNELLDALKTKGLRAKLHEFFFDVNPNLRSRFKQFSKMIRKDRDVAINIWFDDEESVNENEYQKRIIETCVKKLTKRDNPNKEKLDSFIKEVLNDIEGEE